MIKEIKIDKFNTISQEKRNLPNGEFYYLENVNAGEFDGSVKQITNVTNSENDICILKVLKYGGVVYALGMDNSTNKDVTLYYDNAGTWTALGSGTVAGGTLTLYDPFFAILEGIIYFNTGHGYIGKYTLPSTMAATPAGYNYSLFGGVNWKGNLYGWDTNNTIYVVTSSSATAMVTAPKGQEIKQLVPYGDYLAVVCTASSTSYDGISRVYLWDGVTTTSFTEIIEVGFGTVSGGAVLDGSLVIGITFPNQKGFRLKAYSGGIFQTVFVFTYYGKKNEVSDYIYSYLASNLKAYTGYIYFLMIGARPGSDVATVYEPVLMRFGRKNVNDIYSLSAYKDLTITPSSSFSPIGNTFLISEDVSFSLADNSNKIYAFIYEGAYKTRQLVSVADTYTSQAGVVQTGIYDCNDATRNKHLKGVKLSYNALTTTGQVDFMYKANSDTSWTTIFTDTTDGSMAHEAVCIEADGSQLPIFKTIQFRTELLGGAELTGIQFKYEEENQSF